MLWVNSLRVLKFTVNSLKRQSIYELQVISNSRDFISREYSNSRISENEHEYVILPTYNERLKEYATERDQLLKAMDEHWDTVSFLFQWNFWEIPGLQKIEAREVKSVEIWQEQSTRLLF